MKCSFCHFCACRVFSWQRLNVWTQITMLASGLDEEWECVKQKKQPKIKRKKIWQTDKKNKQTTQTPVYSAAWKAGFQTAEYESHLVVKSVMHDHHCPCLAYVISVSEEVHLLISGTEAELWSFERLNNRLHVSGETLRQWLFDLQLLRNKVRSTMDVRQAETRQRGGDIT